MRKRELRYCGKMFLLSNLFILLCLIMFVTIARDVRYKAQWFILKALHTFGNVQRPVFPFSVSQHMHTTNLWNLDSIGQLKLQEKNDEKTPLLIKQYNTCVCFQMPKKASVLKLFNIWVRNYLIVKNCVTSEGAVSHNILYYQQLSNTRYRGRFNISNHFD